MCSLVICRIQVFFVMCDFYFQQYLHRKSIDTDSMWNDNVNLPQVERYRWAVSVIWELSFHPKSSILYCPINRYNKTMKHCTFNKFSNSLMKIFSRFKIYVFHMITHYCTFQTFYLIKHVHDSSKGYVSLSERFNCFEILIVNWSRIHILIHSLNKDTITSCYLICALVVYNVDALFNLFMF